MNQWWWWLSQWWNYSDDGQDGGSSDDDALTYVDESWWWWWCLIWDTKGTDTMLETTQRARRGNASNLSPVALAQPSSSVQPNKQFKFIAAAHWRSNNVFACFVSLFRLFVHSLILCQCMVIFFGYPEEPQHWLSQWTSEDLSYWNVKGSLTRPIGKPMNQRGSKVMVMPHAPQNHLPSRSGAAAGSNRS